jgi:disulfide bond formation protein DsbB
MDKKEFNRKLRNILGRKTLLQRLLSSLNITGIHREILSFFAFLAGMGAFIFSFHIEYNWGFKGCELCQYERLPYLILIGLFPISAILTRLDFGLTTFAHKLAIKWVPIISLSVFALNILLSIFHLMVEYGLASYECLSIGQVVNTLEELRQSMIANQDKVPCNVVHKLYGLSLPAWNIIFNIGCSIIMLWLWRSIDKRTDYEIYQAAQEEEERVY